MSLTMESVYQILDVLEANENCALNLDAGDVKITIVKGNIAAPLAVTASPSAAAAAPAAPAVDIDVSGLVPITANVTSVFYRKPSPDKPPFVELGDLVEKDTVVCLLEVMKCFRQVTADVKGVIEKICVESNHFVEQGTTLFLIRPIG